MKTRPLIFSCGLLGKCLSRKPPLPLSHNWAELASRSSVPLAGTAARHGRRAWVWRLRGARRAARGKPRTAPTVSRAQGSPRPGGSGRKRGRRAALPVPPEASGGGARILGRLAPRPSGSSPPWSWRSRGGGRRRPR